MNFKCFLISLMTMIFMMVNASANSLIITDKDKKADTFLKVDSSEGDLFFSQCQLNNSDNCEELGHISAQAFNKISNSFISEQRRFNAHIITGTIVALGTMATGLATGFNEPGSLVLGTLCGMMIYALAPNASITMFPKNLKNITDKIDSCDYASQTQEAIDYEHLIKGLKPYLSR